MFIGSLRLSLICFAILPRSCFIIYFAICEWPALISRSGSYCPPLFTTLCHILCSVHDVVCLLQPFHVFYYAPQGDKAFVLRDVSVS